MFLPAIFLTLDLPNSSMAVITMFISTIIGPQSTLSVFTNINFHLVERVHRFIRRTDGVGLFLLQADEGGLVLDVALLQLLSQLGHLSLPLLAELNLGGGGPASLFEPLPRRGSPSLWPGRSSALALACLLASSSSSLSSILPWFSLMDF